MNYTPLTREQMAWRAAQDLPEGAFVNLGIGIPTLTASFVPTGREVIFHSENGVLGLGPKPQPGQEDPYQNEWDELIEAIRNNKPYNEAKRGVEASITSKHLRPPGNPPAREGDRHVRSRPAGRPPTPRPGPARTSCWRCSTTPTSSPCGDPESRR